MSIYYFKQRSKRRNHIQGSGLFSSIFNAVTSNAAKEVATQAAKQIATKAITETGNRVVTKAMNKIIPPVKGKSLNTKSKNILDKYNVNSVIPIEEYIKL